MSTTLLQLRSETLNILNQELPDGAYSESYLNQKINEAQTKILESKFSFAERDYYFETSPVVTLAADVDTTDITISVASTDGFPTSGNLYIEGDVVSYTGITDTTFTGVDDISVSHLSGIEVQAVFSIPTLYNHTPQLYINNTNGAQIEYTFIPFTEWENSDITNKFTFIKKSGNEYIFINVDGNYNSMFRYQTSGEIMDSDSEVCIIPDRYALSTIPRLAAGEAMIEHNDNVDGIGSTILQLAEKKLTEMRKYYGARDATIRHNLFNRYKAKP